jgi:HK97 family phage major capsid protein
MAEMMKKEMDGDHPAKHYLVVDDPQTVTTWHLRVMGMDGKPDHTLMGAAWAALHGGYRGSKYEGPNKQKAIDKLTALYASENMNTPGKTRTVEEWLAGEMKVGRTISADTATQLQSILDIVTKLLGLEEADAAEDAAEPQGMMSMNETLVQFGDAVKAISTDDGKVKVGGYLVRFTPRGDYDASYNRDRFDKTTDFDFDFPGKSTAYFNHGLDNTLKKRRLSPVILSADDVGIWAEGLLDERDKYEAILAELAKDGLLGWSSGVPAHLVDREKEGKGHLITYWPLGKDASYTHTPAEPRNVVLPLKSLHMTPAKLQESIESKPINHEESEMPEIDVKTSLQDAAKAEAKVYMDAFIEEFKRTAPATIKASMAVQVTQDEADIPFKTMGAQLAAVKQATLTQGRELAPRLKALNIKALGANELIGSEGGFLLEPTFAAALLTPVHATGPFSSRASKLPIGPNSNGVTVRAVDEISRVAGARWGGIQGYRLNEAGTATASQPSFRLVELRLKKYVVLCYATEELMIDTIALGAIMQQGCSEEFDVLVNEDIVNGTGVGGPLGIMASPALISVTKESGQAAATIVTQNILNMWKRMHPASKGNSVWYINTDCTSQIYAMSMAVGTGGMPMFMLPGSLPNSPAGTLMGRPVIETEYNQTCGTTGDIILADMSQYAMIDRDVQSASSIHLQFLTDQLAFRFIYRCDGQPKVASPLTPLHGSNTLSPFVALNTRA